MYWMCKGELIHTYFTPWSLYFSVFLVFYTCKGQKKDNHGKYPGSPQYNSLNSMEETKSNILKSVSRWDVGTRDFRSRSWRLLPRSGLMLQTPTMMLLKVSFESCNQIPSEYANFNACAFQCRLNISTYVVPSIGKLKTDWIIPRKSATNASLVVRWFQKEKSTRCMSKFFAKIHMTETEDAFDQLDLKEVTYKSMRDQFLRNHYIVRQHSENTPYWNIIFVKLWVLCYDNWKKVCKTRFIKHRCLNISYSVSFNYRQAKRMQLFYPE